MEKLFFPSINRLYVTHPWNRTDDTVLLVYNTSMDTKIFTFGLPGQCEGNILFGFIGSELKENK